MIVIKEPLFRNLQHCPNFMWFWSSCSTIDLCLQQMTLFISQLVSGLCCLSQKIRFSDISFIICHAIGYKWYLKLTRLISSFLIRKPACWVLKYPLILSSDLSSAHTLAVTQLSPSPFQPGLSRCRLISVKLHYFLQIRLSLTLSIAQGVTHAASVDYFLPPTHHSIIFFLLRLGRLLASSTFAVLLSQTSVCNLQQNFPRKNIEYDFMVLIVRCFSVCGWDLVWKSMKTIVNWKQDDQKAHNQWDQFISMTTGMY